jgi:hypothetical protein
MLSIPKDSNVRLFILLGIASLILAVSLLLILLLQEKSQPFQPVFLEQQPITFTVENADTIYLTSMLEVRNYSTDRYEQRLSLFDESW